MRKTEFCLSRTFIQSCLDEAMPVIFQAAAYYFPGNVADALWGTQQHWEGESGGINPALLFIPAAETEK